MRCNWAKIVFISWALLALVVGCTTPPAESYSPNTSGNAPTVAPLPTATSLPSGRIGAGAELPALPDFQEVLSYGGGGGGDPGCLHDPGTTPALTIEPEDFRVAENYIALCLWGVVQPGASFWVELISPDGRKFRSSVLSEDMDRNFQWQGYPVYQDFGVGQSALSGAVTLAASWPTNLPEGVWRATASVGNTRLTAQAFLTRTGKPSISAIHPDTGTEILPMGIDMMLMIHPLRLQDSGHLDVYGVNYPANAPVFVVMYEPLPPSPEALYRLKLMHKQAVLADSKGTITAQIPGSFVSGSSYLVMGVSDSSTASEIAANMGAYLGEVPYDFFRVEPSGSLGACPGAPPQRMVVSQKGRVCTQSDAVRLHSSASQLSDVLAKLPPASEFTVLAGPSCASNSSWWKIRVNDGTIGWVSEGGDEADPYFICPLP